MNEVKHIIYIIIIFILVSCNGNTQTVKSKVKDTPQVRKMLKIFNEQEHRIKLNACEMVYNEKVITMGSTIDELFSVLGKPETIEKAFNGKNFYTWLDGVVSVREGKSNQSINYISVDFESMNSNRNLVILFQGIPLSKTIVMADLINNSEYEFSNFHKGNNSYEITFEDCDKPVGYYISSKVPWVYKGSGHLMVKDKIGYDNTYKIEAIEISRKSE